MLDYGPSNVAKFGGTKREAVESFFAQLKHQILLRRQQVKGSVLPSNYPHVFLPTHHFLHFFINCLCVRNINNWRLISCNSFVRVTGWQCSARGVAKLNMNILPRIVLPCSALLCSALPLCSYLPITIPFISFLFISYYFILFLSLP